MATVNAINSQLSFGRAKAAQKPKESEETSVKQPKPNFAERVRGKYVSYINDKYDVNYDELDPKGRSAINRDLVTEKTLCAGLAILSAAMLFGRTRNIFNGLTSSLITSGKRLMGKTEGTIVNGKQAQGLGEWLGDRANKLLNAPKLKETLKETNGRVSSLASEYVKKADKNYRRAARVLDSFGLETGKQGTLLDKIKSGNAVIDADDMKGAFDVLDELDRASKGATRRALQAKIQDKELSGAEAEKYLGEVSAAIKRLMGQKDCINLSRADFSELVAQVEPYNDDLANAFRRFAKNGAEVVSIPRAEFDRAIALNKRQIFENAAVPGKFDTDCDMHRLLNKFVKDPANVQGIENSLAQRGYTDGAKVVDAAVATGTTFVGGNTVYKLTDVATDTNDDSIGEMASKDEKKVREMKESLASKKGKLSKDDIQRAAGLAMSVLSA